jgi:sulfotransferase family protein
LPVFRFDKIFRIARRVKRFLRNPENALRRGRMRSKRDEFKQLKNEVKIKRREEYKQIKSEIAEIENELKSKKRETKQIGKELLAAEDPAERGEHRRRIQRIHQDSARLRAELRAAKKKGRAANIGRKQRKKTIQQEIFQLQREYDAAEKRRAGDQEPGTGALPDFVVIGGKKCGTTFLYHLLTQHPLVEPAASKELHFFDIVFDEGIEWYRRCFPQPTWEDGRRTITGEGTPYMAHRLAPERMAQVIPQVRLIALLRNPVDRAYSDYQMAVRKEREPKTFEEAIGLDEEATGAGQERLLDDDSEYLSRGVYVDQLLRWSRFFSREQMLVLKSEDFFERPKETLKVVLKFLDLPEWEPKASETGMERKKRDKRNPGGYEGGMEAATRRRLEEYFEPHNKRLYDYLGTDFGW